MNPYGPPFAPFGGPPRPPIGAPPMVSPMAPPIRFPGMPPPIGMPGMPAPNIIAAPPMNYRVPMMPFPNGPNFGRVPDQLTTVYVGKIPPAVDDDFVRKLLEKCGKVAQWRRVNDPVTGKLKGFGFCDYYNADGALRGLRLLQGLKVGESELLLRVDEKTQKYLDEYEARLKSGLFKKDSLLDPDIKEDDVTKEEILQIVARRFGNKDANKETSTASPTRAASTTTPTTPPPSTITNPSSTTTPPRSDIQPNGSSDSSSKEIKKEKIEGANTSNEANAESDGKNSRQAERERELSRRKEKEENEYRDAVRSWEKREVDVARDREREKERSSSSSSSSSSSVNRAILDAEYDYEIERKKHSREYNRRKREREREKQDDEIERMNEYNESRTPPPLPPLPKEEREESPNAHFPISPPYAPNMNDSEASTLENISDKGKVVLGLSVEKKAKIVTTSTPFDEEDGQGNSNQGKKKRKLPLLDAPLHEENSRQGKLEQVKSLIEQIPTEKDKIFDYPMDWQVIDQFGIVENKMRIWITKQIGELIGEEDVTMIDFIVSRVTSHTPPKSILEQIYFVLDEEAESFVIKMWRRLIFEMLSAKSPSNPT